MTDGPFECEVACNRLCLLAVDGFEMAQPSKSMKSTRPCLVRRSQFERRTVAQDSDGARESELAKLNLPVEAGVSCPQVGRDDQKLIGDGCAKAPAQKRRVHDPRHFATPGTIGCYDRDARALCNCKVSHQAPLPAKHRKGLPPMSLAEKDALAITSALPRDPVQNKDSQTAIPAPRRFEQLA